MHPPLAALVPHRPPMLLLDALVAHDAVSATCAVTVREGAMFVREGRVGATVFVEYMAQCAAAFTGLRASSRGEPVRVGYLLGAREVTLHVDGAAVGDALTVRAELTFDDGAMAAFAGEVRDAEGALLAAAELQVWSGGVT